MKRLLSVLATVVLLGQSVMTSVVYAQETTNPESDPVATVETVVADTDDDNGASDDTASETLQETVADEPEAPAQDDNDPETVEPAEATEEAEATPEDPEVTAPADDADVEAAEPEAPELEEPVVDPVIEPEVVAPTESEEVAPKAEPVAEPEAPVAQEPKAEETAPAAAPAEEVAPVEEKSALATLVKELKEVAPLIGWVDGIQVTVEDPLGGLPEGARMDLTPVAEQDVIGLIDSQLDAKVTKVVAVDITFYDANDQKIEPTQPINVKMMAWDMPEAQSVVHIDDEDNVEEVDAVIEGETARFESDSFSIYAFVDYKYLTVNLYNGGTEPVTIKVKSASELEEIEATDETPGHASIVYDPGVTLNSGEVFRGWIAEKANYTTEDAKNGKTIADIRSSLASKFPLSENETVNFYAMIFNVRTVTYYDTNDVILKTDEILYNVGESAPLYTVNEPYTPRDDTVNFEGWLDLDNKNLETDEPLLYTNGTENVPLNNDLRLKASVQEGHWLVFDENGKGGTYNAPRFINNGDVTSEPTSEMVRNGYTFGGWYKDAACTDGNEFTFGQGLTDNTTIYAKWTAKTNAPYTILIWKQNVAGDGYDFEISIPLNGSVDSTINTVIQQLNGNNAYARINGTNYQYKGFHLNKFDQNVKVNPEGNSVLNVYYDRTEYTLTFRRNQNNNSTIYKTITAKYGQNIGDKFPISVNGDTTYRWMPHSSSTFNQVLVYIDIMPAENVTFTRDDSNAGTKYMEFYVEALPGQEVERTFNGKNFVKQGSTIPAKYNFFTESEDFVELNGYNKFGSDPAFGSNGRANVDDGGTIRLYYTRKVYPINFMDGAYYDGNGNRLEDEESSGQLHEEENIVYMADLSSRNNYAPEQSPEGYVFEGWYIDDACTQPYTFTTMPDGGVTVYAKWRQIQYRVFLHPNAGTQATNPSLDWGSDNQEMNFRVGYKGTISLPEGKMNGYEFVGWYADAGFNQGFSESTKITDAIATSYTKTGDSADFTDPMDKWGSGATTNNDTERFWITKKVDLYARWRSTLEGADGINVVYVDNDGETELSKDAKIYVDSAEAVARDASEAPANQQFKYWVLQTWDGNAFVDTSTKVYPGAAFAVLKVNASRVANEDNTTEKPSYTYTVQLRAEYEDVEEEQTTEIKYCSNYDASDTYCVTKDNITQNTQYTGENKDVLGEKGNREGYTFIGWNTKANGAGDSYEVGTGVGINNEEPLPNELYAQWTPNTYVVKFDSNGGEGTMDDQNFTYDVEQALAANAFTNTGYKFDGWKDGDTSYADEQSVKNLTSVDNGEVKLVAQWNLVNYTITYVLNGGTNGEGNPESYNIETETITLTDPTRAHSNFLGWVEGDKIEKGSTGNKTFTARWECAEGYTGDECETASEYTITYNLDGGSLAEGETNPAKYTVETADFTLNNPTKEGYTFSGWTGTDLSEPTETVTIAQGSKGNREYTANWDVNSYTLTYKVDGVVYGDVESYDYGAAITARPTPTKEGHTFSGWSEIPQEMPAHDVEVIGTFTIDSYTVTARVEGGHGTVEPTSQNVNHGHDAEVITFSGDDKYTVKTITVDGTALSTGDRDSVKENGYIFSEVKADHNLVVTFAADENGNNTPDDEEYRTITYKDGVNGTVFNDKVFENQLDGLETPKYTDNLSGVRRDYVFSGWMPEVKEFVYGDQIYTATWKDDKNNNGIDDEKEKVTLTFNAGNHGNIGGQNSETKGNLLPGYDNYPTAPEVTADTGYKFNTWTPEYSGGSQIPLEGAELSFTATYVCDDGYHSEDGGATCVSDNINEGVSCKQIGAPAENAEYIVLTGAGIWDAASQSYTGADICNWKCVSGTHLANNECVDNNDNVDCTLGYKPDHSDYISGKVDVTWQGEWDNGNWSTAEDCKWKCSEGYTLNDDKTQCINEREVVVNDDNCDENAKPENSEYTYATGTQYYSNEAWQSLDANACAWKCIDHYKENADGTGCVVETTEVDCDASNMPSANATASNPKVTVKWDFTKNDWADPVECEWTCDSEYHLENGACVDNSDSVPCRQEGAPAENAEYVSGDVRITWQGEWNSGNWSTADRCEWNCVDGYEEATSDEGVVTCELKKYTITWNNDDNTLIDTTIVDHGVKPTHDDPSKEVTGYVYTFAGWNPTIVPATENTGYTATYDVACAENYHNKVLETQDSDNTIEKPAGGEFTATALVCVSDTGEEKQCEARLPDNAEVVTGTYTPVWSNGAWSTEPEWALKGDECTYKCKAGYHVNGDKCEKDSTPGGGGGSGGGTYSCRNLPANAEANNDKLPGSSTSYSYDPDSTAACTFHCKSGYHRDGQACVAGGGGGNDEEEIELGGQVSDKCSVEGSDRSPEEIAAYLYACENDITTIRDINEARLGDYLNRAEMAKIVSVFATKELGMKPNTAKDCSNFEGSMNGWSQEMRDFMVMSCQLELMGIHTVNYEAIPDFMPAKRVSRAEFGTILSRILWGNKYEGTNDNYYFRHLDALKANNIITNIDPNITEYRSWVLLMIYRAVSVIREGKAGGNQSIENQVDEELAENSESFVGLANPASAYCVEQGGTVNIVKDDEGNESGMCKLADGTKVDEWEYYRANNKAESETGSVTETGSVAEVETGAVAEVETGSTAD